MIRQKIDCPKKREEIKKKMDENFEKKEIDPNITFAESFDFITKGLKTQDHEDGLFSVMMEADRLRLSYEILNKIQFAHMTQMREAFSKA